MKDIVEIVDGSDLVIVDSIVSKAANVISVQLGDLSYAEDFGVDLNYFLQPGLQFQNESFKSYLVNRLTESQVNVAQAVEVFETLFERLTFYVGDNNANTGALIL